MAVFGTPANREKFARIETAPVVKSAVPAVKRYLDLICVNRTLPEQNNNFKNEQQKMGHKYEIIYR